MRKKCRPPHTHDCMCTHSPKHTLKSIWTDFKAEERILWASASSGNDPPSVTLTYTPVNPHAGGWSNRNTECWPTFSKDKHIKWPNLNRCRQTHTLWWLNDFRWSGWAGFQETIRFDWVRTWIKQQIIKSSQSQYSVTDGNIGAKQTLQRFLVFANQGLNNPLYKIDSMKKRQRERMRIISQMPKRYTVLLFLSSVYVLCYFCADQILI